MAEIGRIGQKRYGGVFYEEFLRELQGIKGIKTYREMADNDDTVGAILFAIKMLIRHTKWNIEPGGDTAIDREAAEFVESCMNDMSTTWTDTISEILSFLTYGWSFHEIVYKRRMGKSRNRKTNSILLNACDSRKAIKDLTESVAIGLEEESEEDDAPEEESAGEE